MCTIIEERNMGILWDRLEKYGLTLGHSRTTHPEKHRTWDQHGVLADRKQRMGLPGKVV